MARLKNRDDTELMPEVAAAGIRGTTRLAKFVLWFTGFALIGFFTWASMTELEEVTRGDGKVIPSRQNQVVQHLDGGIVSAINVKLGQVVNAGQVLLLIDNTTARRDYRETRNRFLSLLGQSARLQAEVDGKKKIAFPKILLREAPTVAARERKEFSRRHENRKSQIAILRQELKQRQQALKEQRRTVATLAATLGSLRGELGRMRAQRGKGAISQLELLQKEREVANASGQLRTERLKTRRAKTSIEEAKSKIDDKINDKGAEARKQLNEIKSQLAILSEKMNGLYHKMSRTKVRSPVRGTIKQLRVSTIGGVVKPGEALVEIVPLDDTLMIEARIRPSDRAFLRPDQQALVKITAYKYEIYGGLEGRVVDISVDTIEERGQRGETFYRIKVRTNRNFLSKNGKKLPIVPGMTATVNIRTGKKTLLDYIFKPLLKTKQKNKPTI